MEGYKFSMYVEIKIKNRVQNKGASIKVGNRFNSGIAPQLFQIVK